MYNTHNKVNEKKNIKRDEEKNKYRRNSEIINNEINENKKNVYRLRCGRSHRYGSNSKSGRLSSVLLWTSWVQDEKQNRIAADVLEAVNHGEIYWIKGN